MLKHVKQATALIFCVVLAVELEAKEPGKGAEKKAEATKRISEGLDPILPDWMNPVVKFATPMLIDSLVYFANKTGFFADFGLSSNASLVKP